MRVRYYASGTAKGLKGFYHVETDLDLDDIESLPPNVARMLHEKPIEAIAKDWWRFECAGIDLWWAVRVLS